ncbi:MAG: hypothetical protein M4579_007223 [Chaenotheca gracillima]|nr:MAG: hypothetical protein M4579_007223 [Chaenotheca gracillima]
MLSPRPPTRGDDPMVDNSSSPELSSPPKSEESAPPSPARAPAPTKKEAVESAPRSHATISANPSQRGVEADPVNVQPAPPNPPAPVASAPAKRKYTRRKDVNKDNSNNASTAAEPKKPRAKTGPKPRATAASTAATSTVPRKRGRNSETAAQREAKASASRQPTITDLVGAAQRNAAQNPSSPDGAVAQNGKNEAISPMQGAFFGGAQSPATAPPATTTTTSNNATAGARTSGQIYDSVRSANMDLNRLINPVETAPPSSTPPPPRTANRASASPSIASLIDPPTAGPMSRNPSFVPVKISGADTGSSLSSPTTIPTAQPSLHVPPSQNAPQADDAEVDRTYPPRPPPAATSKKPGAEGSTAASSAAPSPKPARQKEAPPPLPQGNGLLSSALFGGPAAAAAGDVKELRAPTIDINVPLKMLNNNYINFAKLAEDQYGFNALNPRIAMQRERMAQVAAASAALEKVAPPGSPDEMSEDGSDAEKEKDVEMGGMEAPNPSADGAPNAPNGTLGVPEQKEKKKRKMKSDEYDRDDPFVDDTEALLEEQAATSKDGFFVYCGPLVPEGEKPLIERADGTTAPRRGRGRGRGGGTRGSGPGSRGGRGGAGAGAGAGTGSDATRGGTAARKPRLTKADKARMDQEKAERENMSLLAAKPAGFVG